MEPWLDSLSEDWPSNPHASSPASTASTDKKSDLGLSLRSNSRIPHLAQSLRKDSVTGSFIRPRSSRGIAKAKGAQALTERSASSLNIPSSPREGSHGKLRSTLPRPVSSTFSNSQSSVQHNVVDAPSLPQHTPEWRRRLIDREDIADNVDLFSPSRLEGMFAEPGPSDDLQSQEVVDESLMPTNVKPWSGLKLPQTISTVEQYQSLRASRTRAPTMEALHEVDEDVGEDEVRDKAGQKDIDSMSSILPHATPVSSIPKHTSTERHDLVRQQISTTNGMTGSRSTTAQSQDPRWRTVSGQQEIRDEFISPVTASAQNTIRENAVRSSAELDSTQLAQKLMKLTVTRNGRPSSRSSDYEASYNQGNRDESLLADDGLPDMTSHSLPEDLSMGTQDFVSRSGNVNPRRGGAPDEASFLRRRVVSIGQSTSADESRQVSDSFTNDILPSSPGAEDRQFQSILTSSLRINSHDSSIVQRNTETTEPPPNGSPLKLFGNRDTYTNNKLMRVLGQFAGEASSRDLEAGNRNNPDQQEHSGSVLRMSRFGQGDLDGYHFEQNAASPSAAASYGRVELDQEDVLQDFANLRLEDQNPEFDLTSHDDDADLKGQPIVDTNPKRTPSSPAKGRSPKRRRTLLRDEIVVEGVGIEVTLDQVSELSLPKLGKKRKDARPGEQSGQAKAEILATRSVLRPRVGSRKSPVDGTHPEAFRPELVARTSSVQLEQVIAAELETFSKGAAEANQNSRKPSLATKDYMEEANKVMEIIRARGKPTPKLSGVENRLERPDLNPDSIMDLEIDDDSTKESFSRPPSRERPVQAWKDRRHGKHDPAMASHLKKFQDSDDLDPLVSTSTAGTLRLKDAQTSATAVLGQLVPEGQESSPPNIRILNPGVSSRQKGSGESTPTKQHSIPSSTRRTFATDSSGSSGAKGVINSGTVSIPDRVGAMTFDREKQLWFQRQLGKSTETQATSEVVQNVGQDNTLDEDPFANIPDLSVDEQREAVLNQGPRSSSSPPALNRSEHAQQSASLNASNPGQSSSTPISTTGRDENLCEISPSSRSGQDARDVQESEDRQASLRSAASKHEEELHDGIPSLDPTDQRPSRYQPRVVTVTFSSPVVSEIPYPTAQPLHDAELEDDSSFLPPDDSDEEEHVPDLVSVKKHRQRSVSMPYAPLSRTLSRHEQYRAMTLSRRPVSRIDEHDEDLANDEGLSLIHVKSSGEVTPLANRTDVPVTKDPMYQGSSILCLTPLSEFTMHQADGATHGEESFVAARPHPKALLQAHGSHALAVDSVIKAITDAAPGEPFWEQLRTLDLREKRLQSLHGLDEYCPVLEKLVLQRNHISQLNGLPQTVREIDISLNHVNDFTSWGALQNLQYINVSGNRLKSLECFSSLIHVRRLDVSKNRIHDIEGILDLDGLISLDASDNVLTSLDFEGVDLPRLQDLDLSRNRLSVVQNLHYLPELQTLKLDSNSIREVFLPLQLANLRHFTAANNEMEAIDLGNMPVLEALHLDGNSIRAVKCLESSVNLTTLSLRKQRNSPNIVSTVLSVHNECTQIHLSANALSGGSFALPQYPHYNLRCLELAGCGLQHIPVNFGDYFPNCRTLNFNFNALHDLTPLVGSVKLQNLMLAGNRIKRLRRTCLTLSRLSGLNDLDLRDNPLTVGFYSQASPGKDGFTLADRLYDEDVKWLQTLDETTRLRRRVVELLLTDGCQKLSFLDGATFERAYVAQHDEVWKKLHLKGVLAKETDIEALSNDQPRDLESTERRE